MDENKENVKNDDHDIDENLSDEIKEIEGRDPVEAQQDPNFYATAAAYWDKVPPTVDGVLGGFGHISSTDINGSESFIRSIYKMGNPPGHSRAVDCGAGIGRITKYLLQKHFGKVDLVEQCKSFIEEAKKNFKSSKKVGNFYCVSLQDFLPAPSTYDIIWVQWVLGHLTDDDLVNFLKRMAGGLKKNGVIVIKENIAPSDTELDEEDSSVTRPIKLVLSLIDTAGLKVIKNVQQRNFPRKIYEVRMIALHPT